MEVAKLISDKFIFQENFISFWFREKLQSLWSYIY